MEKSTNENVQTCYEFSKSIVAAQTIFNEIKVRFNSVINTLTKLSEFSDVLLHGCQHKN